MEFIDLFAGLGGFHLALRRLGHTCVFACEIDQTLRDLYGRNFSIAPLGDIRTVPLEGIPKHDILCAGFPCQPFSKAGFQHGYDDTERGNLIGEVLNIAERHRPPYLILENVPEFLHHDDGMWWQWIETELHSLGYATKHHRLSPHKFGIPQVRDRLFIVASVGVLDDFAWPDETDEKPSLRSYIEKNPEDAKKIDDRVKRCLTVWQEFLDLYPVEDSFPSFPIWTMEFGANYEFQDCTPYSKIDELRGARGAFGQPLDGLPAGELLAGLPSYARTQESTFPRWKQQFIRQNRDLYEKHRTWVDRWLLKIRDAEFPASWQKFEWNCKGEQRDLWRLVIQFRASGVRVKRATTSPSIVAMTETQVPIIPWENRYLTPRECAKLQSLGDLAELPEKRTKAFEALGNAVNAQLVYLIAERLLATSPQRVLPLPSHQRSTPPSRRTTSVPLDAQSVV